MIDNNFDRRGEDLRQRARELQRRAGEGPVLSKAEGAKGPAQLGEVLPQALEELQAALEELHIAQEELRQQNQKLAATRQAVEAERKRYQEMFEFTPDSYLVTDGEGIIQEVNRATAALLHMHQDSLVGKPLAVFVAEEDRQAFCAQLIRLKQLQQAGDWQVRIQPREGASCLTAITVAGVRDPQGNPVGLRWLLRDITERKRAEEEIKQRNEELASLLQTQYARLDAILRSTCDGIVVTNGQGEIIQANPVAQTWLTQTLPPEDAAWLRETVQDLTQRVAAGTAGGEQPEVMLELKALDLELKVATISEPGMEKVLRQACPEQSRRAKGKPAVVVAMHDISHLKALDRMKTRFITHVSHALRTPVATIKLYAYLMQQQPEKWKEYLEPLAQEVDHQAQLVQEILQLSRIDAGQLEMRPRPTPLNKLTSIAVANRQALAQDRGLTLEHRSETGLFGKNPISLVDPKRMMQVLNSLVANAIQHTPRGGKVVISTGRGEAEGQMWATATVSDTGAGIPEEELPYIFELFFRGEKPRLMQIPGTGLGLAAVKKIVELHGGQVTVESQVDAGTTFTVWLPLAEVLE